MYLQQTVIFKGGTCQLFRQEYGQYQIPDRFSVGHDKYLTVRYRFKATLILCSYLSLTG